MSDPPPRTEQAEFSTEWLFEAAEPGEVLASVEQLADIGLWAHDPTTGETRWSDRAKRLHGIDPEKSATLEDVLGQYADDDREQVLALFDRAIEAGEPFDVVASFVGDRTTPRAIRMRCDPSLDDDGVRRLQGTVRDVTEAMRTEQRIRVLRETSQQLTGAQSKEDVAGVLADAAANILGLVNTAVRIVDERNRVLETVVVTEECVERAGERPDYPVDGNSAAAQVFQSGEPERFADMRPVDDWERGELVSGLYVPIGDHGVLSAGDIVTDAFDDSDLEAAALLGDLGAETLTRIGWARRSRAV